MRDLVSIFSAVQTTNKKLCNESWKFHKSRALNKIPKKYHKLTLADFKSNFLMKYSLQVPSRNIWFSSTAP